MDRDEALAISFSNLKGSKKKNLLQTAKALQLLRSLPDYRSNADVGSAVGVSAEIVREFLLLLKFPDDIQALFADGRLKLEHGRRLAQLSRQRPELLGDAADAMSGMTAMDARHLTDYLLHYPEVPVEIAKQVILDSKTKTEREYHVVAILSEEDYKKLSASARARKTSLDRLVTSIVKEWLIESSPEQ